MPAAQASRTIRTWTTDSRRWVHYTPRAGDVVICTAAKCGTHWMKQIVSLLRAQSPEPRDITGPTPWFDMRLLRLDDVLATLAAQGGWRVLYTHSPLDAMPRYDEVRYIHVARYGLDMFMSWHNHLMITLDGFFAACDRIGARDETLARPFPRPPADPHAFFQRWMVDGRDARLCDEYPAERYFELERSYWAERTAPNLLLVHFNDLKADLGGEMHRIAAFLGIETPDASWPGLVAAATFDAMKRDAARLSPQHGDLFQGGFDAFLHQGTNARWKDVLTPDEVAAYVARAERELPADLYRWLQHGRLTDGC